MEGYGPKKMKNAAPFGPYCALAKAPKNIVKLTFTYL